jgi:hypothetical protein
MKHGYFFLTCCFLLLSTFLRATDAYGQTPVWQTLITPTQTGSSSSSVTGTAADGAGNVYVGGTFRGSITLGATTLTSAGQEDMFVAKWNKASNSFVWAQRAGGVGEDVVTGLAVNGSSIYLTGAFVGTAVFGTTSLTSAGDRDGVVVKLDGTTEGSFQWAVPFGGTAQEYPAAVAVSGTNVYVAGLFQSTSVAFGAISLPNASRNGAISEGFVAKVSDGGTTGTFAWVQPIAGTGDDLIRTVAVEGNRVYVAGSFSDTVAFGNTTLTGGGFSPFVAKLLDQGTTGSFAWAIQAGGTLIANTLTVSGNAIYVVGRFVSRVTLGSTSFTSVAGGGYDMFVSKITDNGSSAGFTWALRAGSSLSDYAEKVAVQGSQVYVVGAFGGAASFGSSTLTSTGNSDDAFITQVNDAGSTGSFTWAQSAGGMGVDKAYSVTVSLNRTTGNTEVYAGGAVAPPAGFGPLSVANSGTTGVGFLALLTDHVLSTSTRTSQSGLSIYPNPAHRAASVHLGPLPNATQAVLTLTDAMGRVARTYTRVLSARGLDQELDLVGLAPGLYALRVQVDATFAVRQLIVE